jgi:glyoxylate reductase
MKPRIFITHPIAESAIGRLSAVAEVTVGPDSSRILPKADLVEAVKHADILYALLHDVVDREVLEANPNLRAVASSSITPDNIDVAAATERGIPVTVIPAVVTEATADLAFALILAVARRMVEGDRAVRAGLYPGSQSNHLAGAMVYGKLLGLVGAGRIGQAVARRAQGFGMRVLYSDPRRLPEEDERKLGMTQASLDDVLAQADFVSLHPQFSPQTRHLIGERELRLMKPTAFIVNTSRGPVLNEAALARALAEKRIAGAGLDVYEHEPKVSPELVAMTNVVLTPHLGSAVLELREAMAHRVVDNILALIEGRRPEGCINPQVLEPKQADR